MGAHSAPRSGPLTATRLNALRHVGAGFTALALAGAITVGAPAAAFANGTGDGVGQLIVPGGFAPNVPGHAPTKTAAGVARLALAQLGRGLNGPNTIDGGDFDDSSALPDAWCAEFAAWVWGAEGLDTAGLDGWAGSFLSYGQAHGTYRASAPRVGDVALFALDPAVAASAATGSLANPHHISHVGVVVAVSATTVTVVNGDWGDGAGGTKLVRLSTFALARSDAGAFEPEMRQYLAGYVAPAGAGTR